MQFQRSLITIAVLATLSAPLSAADIVAQVDGVDQTLSTDKDFQLGTSDSNVIISKTTGHGINLIGTPITGAVLGKTISIETNRGRAVQIAFGNTLKLGDVSTERVSLYAKGTDSPAASFTMTNAKSVDTEIFDTSIEIQAKNIDATAINGKDSNQGSTASAITAGVGSLVTLGGQETESIVLNGVNESTNAKTGVITLWADGKNESDYHSPAGSVTLTAKTVEINASGYGDVRAIHAGSNTMTPIKPATVKINADRVIISSTNIDGKDSLGISAMSTGEVHISGDTTITATSAILARGDAVVSINADGKHYTQINGNIDFNYDKDTSGTGVNAGVTLNLVGTNSHWNGSPVYSYGSGKPTEEEKTKITGLHVTLADGAQWTPSYIVDTTDDETSGEVGVALNNLVLNDGVINVNHGSQQTVVVQNLKGTGGTINVKASTVDGKNFESGKLEIGRVDASQTNAPSLTVQYTGVNADDVKDQAAALASLNASVKLTDDTKPVTKTNVIQEGAVAGAISQKVAADGTTGQIVQAENTKLSAFGSVAALSAFQWRHDMNDLTKRMGELRTSPEGVGTWARLYGSEQEYGALQAKNTSIQVGSDVDVGMGWKVGAAFSYTDGNATYADGDADNKAYGLGIYGTWMAENGQFVDLIAKYSRLDTDFALNGMNGGFDNNAYSVSAEYGWHLKLGEYAFVEPQAELTYGQVLGDTFTTGNGVKVEQDDFDAFIGRIGVRGGFHFPDNKGVVYVRASVLHDFEGESTAVASLVNDSSVRSGIHEDLGGTWYEVGVGANFNVTDNTYTYVDLEKTSGGEVKENWRWNVGMRYVW